MTVGGVIRFLARTLAILGGLCLCALIVMTLASVTGRALARIGLGPIPGDFELVEAGMGFTVFAFLPWCHLQRGNVSVEVFTSFFGPRVNRLIDVVADALMLAFAVLITWRHILGALEKKANGETTLLLQFPLWWPYAASVVGAVVLVLVALYCLSRSLAALVTGREASAEGGRP